MRRPCASRTAPRRSPGSTAPRRQPDDAALRLGSARRRAERAARSILVPATSRSASARSRSRPSAARPRDTRTPGRARGRRPLTSPARRSTVPSSSSARRRSSRAWDVPAIATASSSSADRLVEVGRERWTSAGSCSAGRGRARHAEARAPARGWALASADRLVMSLEAEPARATMAEDRQLAKSSAGCARRRHVAPGAECCSTSSSRRSTSAHAAEHGVPRCRASPLGRDGRCPAARREAAGRR